MKNLITLEVHFGYIMKLYSQILVLWEVINLNLYHTHPYREDLKIFSANLSVFFPLSD